MIERLPLRLEKIKGTNQNWIRVFVGNQGNGVLVSESNIKEIIKRFRTHETEPRKRKLEN